MAKNRAGIGAKGWDHFWLFFLDEYPTSCVMWQDFFNKQKWFAKYMSYLSDSTLQDFMLGQIKADICGHLSVTC